MTAERQLLELLSDDKTSVKSSRSSIDKTKLKKSNVTRKTATSSVTTKTTSSKTKIISTKNKVFSELPDKLLHDSFEAIENYINDNFGKNDCDNIKNGNKKSFPEIKERKYSDDMTVIDPKLINENDNLTIPDNLVLDDYSPTDVDPYSVQYDKKISVTEPMFPKITEKNRKHPIDELDLDEFMSTFNDDEFYLQLIPPDVGSNKIILDNNSPLNSSSPPVKSPENKKYLSPLKHPVSNPIVKARSMKNRQDIQDFLHVKDKSPGKKDEPAFPDAYEEYQRYEAALGVNDHGDGSSDNDDVKINPSPPPILGKISGDSAYGR